MESLSAYFAIILKILSFKIIFVCVKMNICYQENNAFKYVEMVNYLTYNVMMAIITMEMDVQINALFKQIIDV